MNTIENGKNPVIWVKQRTTRGLLTPVTPSRSVPHNTYRTQDPGAKLMKRASNTYRLQMIKEVVTRREQQNNSDPMANYIQQLLDDGSNGENNPELNQRFHGCHYDEQAGGWVSDQWVMK